MTYKLGILDQSPIFLGKSAGEALQSTITLVQQAEVWGYTRFWISEHHQMVDVAGSSPEVLISHLLAKTNSIRVGSGGVMLQHYSPYKVTENFNLLSLLAPDRVELGIGKAPGGFSLSTNALRNGGAGNDEDFDERFSTLHHFVHDSMPEDHPLYGAKAMPQPKEPVPIFLLGASEKSAKLAAETGASFVFAQFLNSNENALQAAIEAYRNIYPTGDFIVAVAAFTASTQEEAEKVAEDYKIYKIHFESGRTISVQSLEQVELLRKQTSESFEITEQEVEMIAGSSKFVKGELSRLAHAYEIDEFIVHTPIQNEEKRLKSFELLRPLTVQSVNS